MQIDVLINGFNLYHGIAAAEEEVERVTRLSVLKSGKPAVVDNFHWLDLPALARSYMQNINREAVVRNIYYFSAYASHRSPDRVTRHRAYIALLESFGVRTVMSQFKAKSMTCPLCRTPFTRHEEKETDVALATQLVGSSLDAGCDGYLLITGDTDILPAIRFAQKSAPQKPLLIAFPFDRSSMELDAMASQSFKIAIKTLRKFVWPSVVEAPDGKTHLKPRDYEPVAMAPKK